MAFWETVEMLRVQQNTSYRWLAMKMGISEQTVSTMRRAGTEPRASEAVKMARALNTTVEYLTDGDNANTDVKVVPGTRQVAVSAPSQDYTVSVYDARGALVRSGKNLSSVDLSGSASGIYLVSVTPHKGNKVVKKIVF